MLFQALCLAMMKRIGGLLLGGLILWQVAEHAGPASGRAIIHVSTPEADLIVDDTRYAVESLWQTPIVCELHPGPHIARMVRDGRVVYQEEFAIAAGEDLILTAWDGYTDGRSPEQGD
jgi:hypothetical protein